MTPPLALEEFARLLVRVAVEDRDEIICRIHDAAGALDYIDDQDRGAIMFEQIADSTDDTELRLLCYKHALFRANWCAQAATSGGEGLSRSQHAKQIESKINKSSRTGAWT